MGRLGAMGKVQDGAQRRSGTPCPRRPSLPHLRQRLQHVRPGCVRLWSRAEASCVLPIACTSVCLACQHIWSGAYDAAHWRLSLCIRTLDVNALEVSSAPARHKGDVATLWLLLPLPLRLSPCSDAHINAPRPFVCGASVRNAGRCHPIVLRHPAWNFCRHRLSGTPCPLRGGAVDCTRGLLAPLRAALTIGGPLRRRVWPPPRCPAAPCGAGLQSPVFPRFRCFHDGAQRACGAALQSPGPLPCFHDGEYGQCSGCPKTQTGAAAHRGPGAGQVVRGRAAACAD